METSHVLIVHNEPAIRRLVARCLGHDQIRVSLAESAEEGLSLLEGQRVHVLLTGADMFGNGGEFVRRAATIQPLLAVVLLADAARIAALGQPTPSGPVQYLSTPVTRESLRSAIAKALEQRMKCSAPRRGSEDVSASAAARPAQTLVQSDRIVAESKAMREILERVDRCAPTDASILISGEPDTGKELIARQIHRQSRRAAGPFVPVTCGALRESELAERLFGYGDRGWDRGCPAPTTLLENAHNGTLFLQDVSQLPSWGQVRVLDVLQQRRCFRAGSNERVPLDVRVIASTTVDLQAAVVQRTFLSSLYYMLNIVPLFVPPLRQRPQDIRPLAETHLAIANTMRSRQGGGEPCRFTAETWQCLQDYAWPGNALQLASIVAHAVLLADGLEIRPTTIEDLLGAVSPQGDCDTISVPLAGGLKEIERSIIAAVIERCRGNKAAAARVLGMHRRTLYRILQDEVSAPADDSHALPLSFTCDPTFSAQSSVET
jgi:two-component system response regulator HydG